MYYYSTFLRCVPLGHTRKQTNTPKHAQSNGRIVEKHQRMLSQDSPTRWF